jgi:hypothetical protein
MQGSVFYWNLLRKYSTVFGALFADVIVRRFNQQGDVLQTLQIPIKYASKSKYIQMLARNQETTKVQMQLPTMSFQMVNMQFDEPRKLSPINKNLHIQLTTGDNERVQYMPMPYKVFFELYIFAKTHDDLFQIIEQIIPYFTPSFSTNLTLIPEMDIKRDVKILLNTMNLDDIVETPIDESNVYGFTISFVMDCWFFGPIDNAAIIKKMEVYMHSVPGNQGVLNVTNFEQYGTSESVMVYPGLTANGLPTSNSSISIPYTDIAANSNYGYITEIHSIEEQISNNEII